MDEKSAWQLSDYALTFDCFGHDNICSVVSESQFICFGGSDWAETDKSRLTILCTEIAIAETLNE